MKDNNYVSFRNIWCFILILLIWTLIIPSLLFAQQQTTTIPSPDEPLIIDTNLITFNVSVTDEYGRAVTGLDRKDFDIFDNKILQEIHFFKDDDTPASISIVFDTSGSMGDDKIIQAKNALASFIQTSQNGDEFFLIDFNSRAKILLDRTRDSEAVLDKFKFVQTTGKTALYDAVYLGLEKVIQGSHKKRIVLIISDGADNNSRYGFKELHRRLKESDVIIYSIGVGSYLSPVKGQLNGRETLDELSTISGGKAFFPKGSEELNEAFERIALEVRHLYSVSYYPSNFKSDGKWHRLMVKLKSPIGSPRLFVRSREGYYAGMNQ